MSPKTCKGETLAQGTGCKVDLCDCGTLHVSVGMVTMRVRREVFAELCRTFVGAFRALEERSVPCPGHRPH